MTRSIVFSICLVAFLFHASAQTPANCDTDCKLEKLIEKVSKLDEKLNKLKTHHKDIYDAIQDIKGVVDLNREAPRGAVIYSVPLEFFQKSVTSIKNNCRDFAYNNEFNVLTGPSGEAGKQWAVVTCYENPGNDPIWPPAR